MISDHILTNYFFHFNIVLHRNLGLFPSISLTKIVYVFLVSLANYMPISSFALRFDQRQVFKRVRFMTNLINFVLHTIRWPVPVAARSKAARLLRSWLRMPPGAWMFVCCVCCVLSGGGLCDKLITRPEESYRLWRVVAFNQETS
jgi:hypothetical protein